jgi:receptor protein-tyrosine kinase
MHYSPPLHNHQTFQRLYGPEGRQIFKGIYNNILLTASETRQKSILICAARMEEGATTVAMGLALAAADMENQPVLLVDGNFVHPQICDAFGQPELYGFGDYLAGRIEVQSVVKKTAIANLHVMGAGVPPLNHVSLLEAPAFRNLMDKLKSTYHVVIIDGPPINTFPESVIYAAQVDRVILVVLSGITRVQVVETALAKLTAGGSENIDVVLNRRTFPIPPWIYRRL